MNSDTAIRKRAAVALILPFLGRWPRWAELFFLSVARNPGVTVLLFCEHVPPFALPRNVRVIAMDRAELAARVLTATGLAVSGISGHKLCDFRPFFGLMFADHLESHEFWGFCDLDVMFGDLSPVVDLEVLRGIDVFTAHDSQIAGHFSIFRNIERVNRAGLGVEGWKEKCSQPATRLVEELDFPVALRRDPSLRWSSPEGLDVELTKPFCRFGVTFDFQGNVAHSRLCAPAVVRWIDGRVHYTDAAGRAAEVLYVHFMGLKRWWHWAGRHGQIASRAEYRFSRVGFGGPEVAESLLVAPWVQIFRFQQGLQAAKDSGGAAARRLLPSGVFRQLRKALLGRGRY